MADITATSTVTSLGDNKVPLTGTTFAPDASCVDSTQFWELHSATTSTWWLAGPRQIDESCWPPLYTGSPEWYYSPAVDCPLGYTSACAQELISTGTSGRATETHVTCCPTLGDFTCREGGPSAPRDAVGTLGCTSIFSTPLTQPVVMTPKGSGNISTATDVTISPPTGSPGTVNAFSVEIAYRSSDAAAATRTGSTPRPSAGGSSDRGGLSTGATAGIAVGVVLGALLVIAAAFLLWRRKRAQKADAEKAAASALAAHEADGTSSPSSRGAGAGAAHIPDQPIEAPGSEGDLMSKPAELSPDGQKPAEMMSAADHAAAELPGDHRTPPPPSSQAAPVEMMGDVPQEPRR